MSELSEVYGELKLMAWLEQAIAAYHADSGYQEGEIMTDETVSEVSRAVAWLASKYGD